MSLLAFTLLIVSPARGEQFWNGAVSYDPPFRMQTNSRPNHVGLPLEDWEFYTWGSSSGTNGPAKISFHVEQLVTPSDPDSPVEPIRTILDLKRLIDSKLKDDPRGIYYSTKIIQFAGRTALGCETSTNQVAQGPSQWLYSVCFFWEQDPNWQKTTVCDIELTAESRETLKILRSSLGSVKVQTTKLKR